MVLESPTRPKRLTREEAKAQTRALLLEAARNMFAQRGYDATTLEEIAAEAGFTKGAMYFHFASKDALFLELLTAGVNQQIGELEALIALAANQPDILEAEFHRFLDQLDEQLELPLLGLEMQIAARRNPEFAELFGELMQRYHEAQTRILADYLRITGRKPAVPIEVLAATLTSISEGVALNRWTQGREAIASITLLVRRMLGDND